MTTNSEDNPLTLDHISLDELHTRKKRRNVPTVSPEQKLARRRNWQLKVLLGCVSHLGNLRNQGTLTKRERGIINKAFFVLLEMDKEAYSDETKRMTKKLTLKLDAEKEQELLAAQQRTQQAISDFESINTEHNKEGNNND